jgi:hypothetical protein
MIDVKVGEQDVVYVLGRDADCPKPLKEWVIQSIEVRRIGTLLPIAGPGVDQDRSAAFLNEPTVNAQQDVLPGLIHSFGWQPVRMIRENACIPIRKQRRRRNISERQFLDARDRGLADRAYCLIVMQTNSNTTRCDPQAL